MARKQCLVGYVPRKQQDNAHITWKMRQPKLPVFCQSSREKGCHVQKRLNEEKNSSHQGHYAWEYSRQKWSPLISRMEAVKSWILGVIYKLSWDPFRLEIWIKENLALTITSMNISKWTALLPTTSIRRPWWLQINLNLAGGVSFFSSWGCSHPAQQ